MGVGGATQESIESHTFPYKYKRVSYKLIFLLFYIQQTCSNFYFPLEYFS